MNVRFLLVSLLIFALTACFPVHYLVRPGISGAVVDDATSAPVAGATVILTRAGQPDSPLIATATDKQGRFAFVARRAWGIYIVPGDEFPFAGTVDIYASGYLKVSREVRAELIGKTSPIALGEVRVKRPP